MIEITEKQAEELAKFIHTVADLTNDEIMGDSVHICEYIEIDECNEFLKLLGHEDQCIEESVW